jgi:drug/metabolite transporter (DMT)-like permease
MPLNSPQSNTTRGVVCMVLGSTLLTTNDAITKWLTQEYPVSQVWCLRTVFVLVLIILLAPRYGGYRALLPNRIPAQLLRAVLFFSTTLLIVTGLSLLPLAQMVAIVFGSPIFVAALAPVFLRERVNGVRWLVIGIGFVGVLFILRPDPTTVGAASLIALAAAVSSALRDLVTRRISSRENSISILFCSSLLVVAIALPIAPWLGWVGVQPAAWALLFVNGVLNGAAHFLIIEALRFGEASVVTSYRYSALLWGAILGFVIWGDVPDLWVAAGGVLIVGSGLFLLYQERR